MAFANAFALPRSDSSHDLRFIANILTQGYAKSISNGELILFHDGYAMDKMQTVFETRKGRLRLLRERYKNWGDLNEAIGWTRTDPRLSQIHSESIRSDRGTPYVMGDPTARLIEAKLKLGLGWMDTPVSYAELDPMIADLIQVARQLREENRNDDLAHLVRVGHTFVEPHPKAANGEQ